ncbi:hypothetical protein AXF42_Ash013035 [Apostasia shenzhenica]|uniref:FMP27/BLTP2/Hobbit GFWDK motif-containing RBG unit domain-containing protein n=1 Tax=Apostasia shenzhenica TaxID=1088818 RepID=A0A2I0ARZ3_9ASPA|nr:hypothetical protein AXF42_Ash013035 [Apostasia shenzhenica]
MASSPVKFLFAFLVVCGVGWIIFTFAARLLAWFLSRILRASVGFKVAGFNCVRDVNVKFDKGTIDSLSIGEIKLSFRKSLVKLGFSFISRDPKLQLLISDLEVSVRSSNGNRRVSQRSRGGSRGKWMVLINVARLLSISVTELAVKVTKAALEVKDLRVEMSKSCGPTPVLNIKLYLVPLFVQIFDSLPSPDYFSFDQREWSAIAEKYNAPFICEDLSVASELVHDKDQGIRIKNLDMTCGDITLNLTESLFVKTKIKSEVPADSVDSGGAGYGLPAAKISQNDTLSRLKKQITFFPDKVNFRLPKLNVRFIHHAHGLLGESDVMGINLRSNKSQIFEESGDISAHLDMQTDMTEIHLLKVDDTSTLEILRVVLTASVDVPLQQTKLAQKDDELVTGFGIDPGLSGFGPGPKLSRAGAPLGYLPSFRAPLLLRRDIGGEQVQRMMPWAATTGVLNHVFAILPSIASVYSSQLQIEADCSIWSWSPLPSTPFLPIKKESLFQPIRSEIDVKLGGTQCTLIVNRLKPWLGLHLSRKKQMVAHAQRESSRTSEMKAIMWTCTVSAPEMTILLYSLNDLPLYYVCSQSSHLFANNIACKGLQVHAELGELHYYMEDEYQKCLKQDLLGVEANSGSLLHIARVSLDWGLREMETHEEEDPNRLIQVFATDISSIELSFGFRHIESLILTLTSLHSFVKSLPLSGKQNIHDKIGHSSQTVSKGTRIFNLNLEKCHIKYYGDVSLEDMVIVDPKRVNFGSQGGIALINLSSDGTPRRASIMSNTASGCKKLKFSASLNLSSFSICLNKDKHSLQVDLERARSVYEDGSQEQVSASTVTLLEVQHAKFVRRSGGLSEVAACSLFNATDITVRWEPDIHLAVFELLTSVKCFMHKMNNSGVDHGFEEVVNRHKDNEITMVQAISYKGKKKETIFAIDVEKLKLTAELADGVETSVTVQSIFSENARIGVLFEDLVLSFDGARVFKSSRIQISRIPVYTLGNLPDAKVQSLSSWDSTSWDWVVQGPDLHICMPYRLQLRAIEDAVEDMLRGLKLITNAKASLMLNIKKENSKKPRTNKTSKFGTVRFIIRKLTADIEEEPMQGWLDEHYQLMKTEICEAAVRTKFLDEFLNMASSSGVAEPMESSERKFVHNGKEIDITNTSIIKDLYLEIHKQSFQSYFRACRKLAPSEGSGACMKGFESGFKPSKNRASLLSLCASELDVTLTKIVGGYTEMVEFIKKIDPISFEGEIPFSRTYGRDIDLTSGSLVIQLRNYTFPLFSATAGKCKGRIVFAQQYMVLLLWKILNITSLQVGFLVKATCFQPQVEQDVYIGKWWKVRMLRSASGTTPPMKMYSDLPINFDRAEVSFGVGYEPAFADVSYAFTVALRRANLGKRTWASSMNDRSGPVNLLGNPLPKKERSLPWWDDMRYYIHGKICFFFLESRWNLLATTNPYEKLDKLQIVSAYMEIQQTDGRVCVLAKDFKIILSSLESLLKNCSLKLPSVSIPFIRSPVFSLDVTMDWDCESGCPVNHYLHALPKEGEPRMKVYDSFRSTSLSLRWNYSLRPSLEWCDQHASSSDLAKNVLLGESLENTPKKMENITTDSPTMNLGAHDLAWLFKWWSLNYSPPHKIRSFSRWPRYGIPRAARSGNLSLDKVMIEFCLRLDATPTCIIYRPLGEDDPASGLTFEMTRLKYELCYSRGKQLYTFDCKRESLDLVYQGLDLHLLKAFLSRRNKTSAIQDMQTTKGNSQILPTNICNDYCLNPSSFSGKIGDDGFLLYSDYFTIRRQARKADPARLLAWQEAGRRNLEMTYVRSEFENGSESDHTRSDPSDDDGFNVVIADNCRRVFVYGLKLLWTIENRDAVWSWVGGISKAFEPQKPSPSRQYAQRKLLEDQQSNEGNEIPSNDILRSCAPYNAKSPSAQRAEALGSQASVSPPAKTEFATSNVVVVIVVHYQHGHELWKILWFEVHKKGRFLLAAASGRVLARSFHSVLHVGYEMIEQALGASSASFPDLEPEMTWKRAELSVMLEHVQAHVAPTDVDPGAGLQWLPKILRSSPKVKRTGALLERVFMPCQMYFRYTRHKGGTTELKVKPLKELIFNSPNITATMTSRQFQVRGLRKELGDAQKSRKEASSALRMALQKAAQFRLMEKEKNKSPSYAMRISMRINKVVWSMLADGKSFAEAEINDMIYDFDRDYKDIGVAQFTTKFFVVRNCLPNAKSDLLLSAWNAPPEWGKNFMLRVNAKQGAPKDSNSPLELFQEVWKVSTTAGSRRVRKSASGTELNPSNSHYTKEPETTGRHIVNASTSIHGDSSHAPKPPNLKSNNVCESNPELRPSSSYERMDENLVDSVTDELVLPEHNLSIFPLNPALESQQVVSEETSRSKAKDNKVIKSGRLSYEDKKIAKPHDDKRARTRKMMEFNNIKISQVELLVTYEGSRFAVNDLRLLMDTFHRDEFIGTWRRLFSRVKKHIIWGVLKSVTGMQGKKFKDKAQNQREGHIGVVPESDIAFSDSDGGQPERSDQFPVSWLKRPSDGAGDGFVTSIRGLFNSQRRKAKAFVLRTMRGEAESEFHGDWSESDTEYPFARQLTITKAKKIIKRHTRKFRSRGQRNSGTALQIRESHPSTPREMTPFQSDTSGGSSYEDFNE